MKPSDKWQMTVCRLRVQDFAFSDFRLKTKMILWNTY